MERIVAIISDYGLRDHYVGTVHGVIKSAAPEVQIVDITHYIRPFDVVDAALKLKWSYKYFPTGTVFLCLVDPDPSAELIIATTERYFVVSPNNGVGSLLFEEEPVEAVYRIDADHYFLQGPGNFRGRNQLAPIAAELSRIQIAKHFGSPMELSRLKRFKLPTPKEVAPGTFEVIVIDIDSFGNIIFNMEFDGEKLPTSVEINGTTISASSTSFSGFERGTLFISVSPEGNFELVAYMANAASLLKVKRGMKALLKF